MDRILVNGFSKKNGIDEAEMQVMLPTYWFSVWWWF